MTPAGSIRNLDILCATLGEQLAKATTANERTVNEALGVVEEQGPYAMCLYLKARHDNFFRTLSNHLPHLLQELFGQDHPKKNLCDYIKSLAHDLDKLLFLQELLRTSLCYARYYIKAKEAGA